ncbi:hypothetical protein CTEN210_16659 [Chaetoceros tenuissimus]|uniref:Calmodulin n=1 Tax=Chaetoceros tenuissimus TaxID=426638 RepID=A0AAD3HEM2_9STRA|nr:hypothetical protein CTEN210_16659 [Chaetoceros tenuissimus]
MKLHHLFLVARLLTCTFQARAKNQHHGQAQQVAEVNIDSIDIVDFEILDMRSLKDDDIDHSNIATETVSNDECNVKMSIDCQFEDPLVGGWKSCVHKLESTQKPVLVTRPPMECKDNAFDAYITMIMCNEGGEDLIPLVMDSKNRPSFVFDGNLVLPREILNGNGYANVMGASGVTQCKKITLKKSIDACRRFVPMSVKLFSKTTGGKICSAYLHRKIYMKNKNKSSTPEDTSAVAQTLSPTLHTSVNVTTANLLSHDTDPNAKGASFFLKRLLFNESSLVIQKKHDFSFNLSIHFETNGLSSNHTIDTIASKFDFIIRPVRKGVVTTNNVPLELFSECVTNAHRSPGKVDKYGEILPLAESIADNVVVFEPYSDQPTSYKSKKHRDDLLSTARPFDETLLSYLTVLICVDQSIPCDMSKIGDGTTVAIKEYVPDQLLSSKSAKGSSPPLPYLELYQDTYYARWNIEDMPALMEKDIRVEFYVMDMFLDTLLLPYDTSKGWKWNMRSPISFHVGSHPAIRARLLRDSGDSAYTVASHLMCEFYASASASLLILYREEFSPSDVAKAMKFAYNMTAEEFAQFGSDNNINDDFVSTGLNDCAFSSDKLPVSSSVPLARTTEVEELLDAALKSRKKDTEITYKERLVEILKSIGYIFTTYSTQGKQAEISQYYTLPKKAQLEFVSESLELRPGVLNSSREDSVSFLMSAKFEVLGLSKYERPIVAMDITQSFDFFFEAFEKDIRNDLVSMLPICLSISRDPDGSSATTYEDIMPIVETLADNVVVFEPYSDQPTSYKSKKHRNDLLSTARPFDETLLSYLTVLICVDQSIPCDMSKIGDGTTVAIKEYVPDQLLSSKSAKGSSPPLPYLELYQDTYYARWNIEDMPALMEKDIRVEFYVMDMFLDTLLLPYDTSKGWKWNMRSPISFHVGSHPAIRARLLRDSGDSAYTVASHLMCEFYASASASLLILYREEFSPSDVARALKILYEMTPLDYSKEGYIQALTAVSVAIGLKDKCAFNIQDMKRAAEILKSSGYSAADNYKALRDVYNASVNDAEQTLLDILYPEEEVDKAILPDLLILYDRLAKQYGPRVYLHSEEKFKMSSLDWYLEQDKMFMHYVTEKPCTCSNACGCDCNLDEYEVLMHNETVTKANIYRLEQDLLAEGATKIWIQHENMKGLQTPNGEKAFDAGHPLAEGYLESAKAYIKAVRIKPRRQVDLTFWIWYPYNGPGTMQVKLDVKGTLVFGEFKFETGKKKGNTDPLGDHPTDWEQIILRFDEATEDFISLTTSGHGAFTKYNASEIINVEDTDIPKTYTALNGHAIFSGNDTGENMHETLVQNDLKIVKETPFTLFLDMEMRTFNFCEDNENLRYLETSSSYEIFAVDRLYVDLDGNIDESSWAAFSGAWGPDTDYGTYDRRELIENIIDGGNISGKLQEFLLLQCGIYSKLLLAIPIVGLYLSAAAAVACAAAIAFNTANWWTTLFTDSFFIKAVDALVDEVIEEDFLECAVDSQYSSIGTSKKGPGHYRQITSQWLRAVKETPRMIDFSINESTKSEISVSGNNIEFTVKIFDKFFEEKPHLDYRDTDNGIKSASFCTESGYKLDFPNSLTSGGSYTLLDYDFDFEMAHVQLVIDNYEFGGSMLRVLTVSGDLSNSTETLSPLEPDRFSNNGNITITNYIFSWDSDQVPNGRYSIRARIIGTDKRKYGYDWDLKTINVCNGNCDFIDPIEVNQTRISEGSKVQLEVDFMCSSSDNCSVSLDWGDGEVLHDIGVLVMGQIQKLLIDHIYYQSGSFEIAMSMRDGEDNTQRQNTFVTVVNEDPKLKSISVSPSEPVATESKLGITLTFQDDGRLDNHTIVTNWGDGDTVNSTYNGDASTDTQFLIDHEYKSSGVYYGTTFIEDSDGGQSVEETFMVTAYNSLQDKIASSGQIEYSRFEFNPITNITTVVGTGNATVASVFSDDDGKLVIHFSDSIYYMSTSVSNVETRTREVTARGDGELIGSNHNGTLAFEVVLRDAENNRNDDSFELKLFNASAIENPWSNDLDPFMAIEDLSVEQQEELNITLAYKPVRFLSGGVIFVSG